MLEKFANIFRVPDLRKRVLFTLAMLAVYRLGAHIPTPGIDTERLAQQFASCLEQQLKNSPAGPPPAASNPSSPSLTAAPPAPAAAAKPVSAFRLAWEVIRASIGRLFRRR